MKRVLQTLATLAVLGAVAGGAVVLFGLYNVAARQGHWPGVSWVLHTTYRNAVERLAPPASAVPELDEDQVALGARHFETACSGCHAAPGEARSATIHAMVPRPPHIERAVSHWDARHLFWIVDEGVKMSGMPHWPSRVRHDDVWHVVAFLDAVPDLDREGYRTLVAAEADPAGQEIKGVPEAVARNCVMCHAVDGRGIGNDHVPRLDLQQASYLAASLRAYREDHRFSGIMQHAASTLDDGEISALADWYGARPVVAERGTDSEGRQALVERGRAIATGQEDAREIPSCQSCHGPWPAPVSNAFPSILGQREAYLVTQLRLWRDGERGGTDRAKTMHRAADALDDAQIEALAAFYATQKPRKQDRIREQDEAGDGGADMPSGNTGNAEGGQ